MGRLLLALGVLSALAALAWRTMANDKFRLATLLILALFAVKVLVAHKQTRLM